REITITVRNDEVAQTVKSTVATIEGVINVEILEPRAGRSRVRVDFAGDDDGVEALNQKLVHAGIAVLGFNEEMKDLETMFMSVTKGIVT
ncbi:MAG: hypothetical protein K8L99_10515, partial [Anaerolineae bacterium]|nr:hypothetical protein [Anaerolineae bacterium]